MTAIEARAPTDRPSGSGAVAVPPTIEVRRARETDIPVLAEVLARAFAEDPALSYFTQRDERQHERMVAGMEAMLRYGSARLSDTYTTADLAGAAIWTPPGYSGLGLREWPGMLRKSLFMCGWRGLVTIRSARRVLDERLVRHIPEPNYYLSVIGVDPAGQGQGVGSALMRPILERCDQERVPASLATNLERNVRLYERHGFRVVDEVPIPKTTIPTWFMRRDPA
jgi:ribosomal protein S18 acetylase RimI-like enzyme